MSIFMAHKEKNNRQERGFLRKTKEVKMNRITINGKQSHVQELMLSSAMERLL